MYLSYPWYVIESQAFVSSCQKPVLINFVCHPKSRILNILDVSIKVFQVNSQHDIINSCQMVKIVASELELAFQVSKLYFVRFLFTIEVKSAVQRSQKNGPTYTVRSHVTQHLHRASLPSGLMVYAPLELKPSWNNWEQLFTSVDKKAKGLFNVVFIKD